MDKKLIIVLGVFLTVALCVAALYSTGSNHEEIPFKSIGNPTTQSHVLGSIMKNDDLIVTIETTEPVTVKPPALHHSVSLDGGISTVTIFNYTGQIFHIAVGNTSGIHLFGALDKKEYNKINKTVTIINDTSKKTKMTIKLLSSEPDLTTFTEIFEVTNFEMYTPAPDLDFKARSVVHKGGNGVSKTEWFIGVNQSYVVNITDYKTIQVKKEVHNNKTGKNGTVFVNKTVVSGYHKETQYRNVWADYDKYGTELPKNTIQKVKVIYHKKAELGNVHIQTVPVFCGVECDELTWWNTSWGKRVQRNINNASVALTDYQLINTTTYDSDMNANFSDLRFTNDAGTLIPYWIESKTDSSTADIWLKIPSISTTTGATIWMYYNNSAVSSASNGDDTFIQWHGTATSDFLDSLIALPSDYIYESKSRVLSTGAGLIWGISNEIDRTAGTTDSIHIRSYATGAKNYFDCMNDGGRTYVSEAPEMTTNQWYDLKITRISGTAHGYVDGNEIVTGVSSGLPNENMGLWMQELGGTCEQEYSYLRKYAATEPTWGADGAVETVSLQDLTITAYAPTTPITLELGTSQTFNVTTNITSSCRWYINGSLKQTNSTGATEHAYTNTSLEAGYWNFTAYTYPATENASQTWWVTVNPEYDSTDSWAGAYYPLHYVEFIVTNSTGALYGGVSVSAKWTDSSGAPLQIEDITGSNGAAVFNMTQDVRYTMTFIHTEHGINETRVLYPIDSRYYIYINESYTYDPGNVSTDLTNYSTTNTTRGWAFHNHTSTDLNSTIGLGMLGQGIVASTAIWAIVGAGGPAAAFASIAAMAALGIVTWILVLFCGMTMVALYILGGKIRV